ncbi:hypothetical protein V7S43_012976 [Phytophthora oleae]|uniref:RxLR effector protein n=2 Tax=Phytophthora oleae TaxID=2107226 RepID=A0ABD3F744_9STRA
MKTSFSVLATIAMLAVAALSVPGTLADQTSLNPVNEKASWAPRRALESMTAPYQQGPLDANKKKKRQDPNKKDDKHAPRALLEEGAHFSPLTDRALGHAPAVTPVSTTTSSSTATPAPTKTNPPKPTPAATTTSSSNATPVPAKPKVTPAATKPKANPAATKGKATTSSSNSKTTPCPPTHTQKDTPTKPKPTSASTTNKGKPKATPSATTSKTTPTPTVANKGSSPVQQKHRNLRDNWPKQQQQQQQSPHHAKKNDKTASKYGDKHHQTGVPR